MLMHLAFVVVYCPRMYPFPFPFPLEILICEGFRDNAYMHQLRINTQPKLLTK